MAELSKAAHAGQRGFGREIPLDDESLWRLADVHEAIEVLQFKVFELDLPIPGLAAELAPYNIRVNAINPGMVETEGFTSAGLGESD